jgi:FkbM family methyltransferase
LIDVGGNVGDWASDFRLFFPNSDIVAFEPDPRAYAAYAARFRSAPRVTVHNFALSDVKGEAMFRMAEESVYSSLEAYASTQDERNIRLAEACTVPLAPLDSVAIDLTGYGTIVLKIDVQGHEIEVLRGTAEALRMVDVLIGELAFAGEYEGKPPSFAAVCGLLNEAGLFPAVFQCYSRLLGP